MKQFIIDQVTMTIAHMAKNQPTDDLDHPLMVNIIDAQGCSITIPWSTADQFSKIIYLQNTRFVEHKKGVVVTIQP